jgi:CBS-domain-containing membrane protein
MKAAGAAYLVVIHDGEIVGVVSRSDLGGPSGGAHRRMGRRIGDLMQRKVAIVKPGTSVRRAAKLMRRQGLGCLPVQKGDKLVGVVTEAELLRVLERLLAK